MRVLWRSCRPDKKNRGVSRCSGEMAARVIQYWCSYLKLKKNEDHERIRLYKCH